MVIVDHQHETAVPWGSQIFPWAGQLGRRHSPQRNLTVPEREVLDDDRAGHPFIQHGFRFGLRRKAWIQHFSYAGSEVGIVSCLFLKIKNGPQKRSQTMNMVKFLEYMVQNRAYFVNIARNISKFTQ